jgi:hypothetical protein
MKIQNSKRTSVSRNFARALAVIALAGAVGAGQVQAVAGELKLDDIKWNGHWHLSSQDTGYFKELWAIKTQLDAIDKTTKKGTGLDPKVVNQKDLKENDRLLMFTRDRFTEKSKDSIVAMEFVKAESFVRETVDGPLVKKLQGHVIVHSVGLNDVQIKSKTYTIDSSRSEPNFMFLTNGPEELILEQIESAGFKIKH